MPLRCRLAIPTGGGSGVLVPDPALFEVTADHILAFRIALLCSLEVPRVGGGAVPCDADSLEMTSGEVPLS